MNMKEAREAISAYQAACADFDAERILACERAIDTLAAIEALVSAINEHDNGTRWRSGSYAVDNGAWRDACEAIRSLKATQYQLETVEQVASYYRERAFKMAAEMQERKDAISKIHQR